MKKSLWMATVLLVLVGVSVVATAQVTKGKTRAATTKQLMGGLVKPNCAAIGAGTKMAPADDKAWEALALNAALLNEAGYMLIDDGRCPDGTWAGAAKALQAASAAVLAKIEAKDLEGTQAEFKKVTETCATCHKAHKKS